MHNIEYETYPENINRKKVQQFWDDYARRNGDGMYASIRWIENGVSESIEEAHARIEKMDTGDYGQYAVKYKQYRPHKTKAIEDLTKRLKEAYEDYTKKSNKIHYTPDTVSAEFISCPGCKSKISVQHIRWNRCPICGSDLRPKTTLKLIENAKKKWTDLQKRLKDEEMKGKYDICWLVKVEYHS